jgi:uroporphyrin-III C-methyltransferase/precorrin-2 dehydrogenase/sirohydrochlorin ferrochelatase
VPGITAASGASAYSGIPLTARGYSKGVRFLTYYKDEQWSVRYWQELASAGETLVLYMSAKRLSVFIQNLLYHGALPDKPIAVIEQATTSFQKVYTFTLQEAALQQRQYKSPSLVVIGEVVKLHDRFNWNDPEAEGRFFEPAIYNTF